MISQYNATEPAPGPKNLILAVGKQLKLQGFIVSSHSDMAHAFQNDMVGWIGAGQMRWQETVLEGIEQVPQAFINLFAGENLGKMLVKLAAS
jgi:NADPH-dependent curcumin reductase CurA